MLEQMRQQLMRRPSQQQKQKQNQPRYKPTVKVESIPPVTFKHVDGMFMYKGIVNPTFSKKEPILDSYLVIPIAPIEGGDSDGEGEITTIEEEPIEAVLEATDSEESALSVNTNSSATATRTTYSDHMDQLCFTSLVAIAHCKNNNNNDNGPGKLTYLSCRSEFKITGSAFCEYRSEIGEYEVFELDYSFEDDTYAFKSRHNQLALHYNPYLRTVAFKPPTASARWHLIQQQQESPQLTTSTSSSPPLLPQVIYLGLVKLHCEPNPVVLAENKKASGFDEFSFHKVLTLLKENVSKPKSCTIFNLPDVQQQWIVETDESLTTAIVITTMDYPTVVAIECNDDLVAMYQQRYKQYCSLDNETTTTSTTATTNYKDNNPSIPPKYKQRLLKELFATRIYYNELEDVTTIYYEPSEQVSKLDQMTLEVRERMQDNIQGMISNLETAEQLKQKTEILLADAAVFKKRAKKLKRNQHAALYMGIMAGLGAAVGGLGGWLMGGPVGAAYLGSQGAEIGVGVGAGIVGGSMLYKGATAASSFWTNKFVHLCPQRIHKSVSMQRNINGKMC